MREGDYKNHLVQIDGDMTTQEALKTIAGKEYHVCMESILIFAAYFGDGVAYATSHPAC